MMKPFGWMMMVVLLANAAWGIEFDHAFFTDKARSKNAKVIIEGKKTDRFERHTKEIHFIAHYRGAREREKVTAVWIAIDAVSQPNYQIASFPKTFSQKSVPEGYFHVFLLRGPNLWPAGRYRVQILSGEGGVLLQKDFMIGEKSSPVQEDAATRAKSADPKESHRPQSRAYSQVSSQPSVSKQETQEFESKKMEGLKAKESSREAGGESDTPERTQRQENEEVTVNIVLCQGIQKDETGRATPKGVSDLFGANVSKVYAWIPYALHQKGKHRYRIEWSRLDPKKRSWEAITGEEGVFEAEEGDLTSEMNWDVQMPDGVYRVKVWIDDQPKAETKFMRKSSPKNSDASMEPSRINGRSANALTKRDGLLGAVASVSAQVLSGTTSAAAQKGAQGATVATGGGALSSRFGTPTVGKAGRSGVSSPAMGYSAGSTAVGTGGRGGALSQRGSTPAVGYTPRPVARTTMASFSPRHSFVSIPSEYLRGDIDGDGLEETVAWRWFGANDLGDFYQILLFDDDQSLMWSGPTVLDSDNHYLFGKWDFGISLPEALVDIDEDARAEILAPAPQSDVSPQFYRVLAWNGVRVIDRKPRVWIQSARNPFYFQERNRINPLAAQTWISSIRAVGLDRARVEITRSDGQSVVQGSAIVRFDRSGARVLRWIRSLPNISIPPSSSGVMIGGGYVARIGTQDLYNSRGRALRGIREILHQDRANYYKGFGDPEDQADPYFATYHQRSRIDRMRIIPIGATLRELRRAIRYDHPLLYIVPDGDVLRVRIMPEM